ncbi:Amino acid transporter [Aphelenchoides fujianensis]|nr:Amino acid transporter [Aphelenchoides fujianensis]
MKMRCFRRSGGWRKFLRFCKENLLLSLTILSVVLGLALGFALRQMELSQESVQIINFPGEIFLQHWPNSTRRPPGQMGIITVGYYATTTVLSTIGASYEMHEHSAVSPLDTFLDVIRNMFPENVIQATFQRVQTDYYQVKRTGQKDAPPITKKRIAYVEGMNILGVIVFCTGFGIVISQFGERTRIIVDFFVILEAVIMKLVETFMWLAPLGIVCLIAGNLLELEDLSDALAVLFMYVVTILTGLAVHTFFTMPGLYFLLTRKNPLVIVKGMAQALVTAFGTASGGAALPVSMQCMEDNLKVDRRITRFVLPLGSTINLDGNALYEAVAVIFIAQLNNITLSIPEVITVSLIATIASLGLNSVPAGLVSILLILNTVDLPTKDISLLITVDWLMQEKLQSMDQNNEFHHEIAEEIALLKSAVGSRKPSVTRDAEIVSELPFPTIVTDVLQSRSHSISVDILSWRDQAILNRLNSKISLPQVKHL